MPRPHTALVVAVLLGGLACAGDPDRQPPAAIAARFIEQESAEAPRPELLYGTAPVFSWSASDPDEAARWQRRELPPEPPSDPRLEPAGAGQTAAWERPLRVSAGDVDRIDLRFAGRPPAAVELAWTSPLRLHSTDRSIRAEPRELSDASGFACTFDLRGHPRWTGRIARLRLGPFAAESDLPVVAVTGSRYELDPDRLAAAAARPWKVEIDHDARNALLVPPGLPSERRLRLPDGARLRFAFGLQRGVRVPVRFEVTVSADGGEPQLVFARRLDPRRGDHRRWHEASVSLAGLSSREVTVRLATRAGRGFDPAHGLPVWANPEIVGGPPPSQPNVVLVCLDTLRADRLSSYGHTLATSPRLDAWAARRGVLFETVVATSPWTLPSHVSMFTGLDALRHGVNHYRAVPPSLELLAERLRRAGYATAAITGGGYLSPRFGFDQGFDRFVHWPHRDSDRELAAGIELAQSWLLDEQGRPFFLFFHTYEVHFPHRRRQPFFNQLGGRAVSALPKLHLEMRSHGWQGLRAPGDYFLARRRGAADWHSSLSAEERRELSLMYDSSVAYADAQVGRLIDTLARLGLAGRTLLIVTSDHGEALGEDGRAGHSYLEDYNLLVPLIVELPGGAGAGTRVDRQVRLTDLAPTILDAVGLEADPAADGVSLLHLLDGAPPRVPDEAWAYAPSSNRGLALRRAGRLKYSYNDTAWEQLHGEERLVDLELDPGERHDLAPGDPRTPGLRALAADTLLAQHRGPRLLIRNASPFVLRGQLRGALAAHDRLKAGESTGTLRWRRSGPPIFVVHPGEQLTLLLSSPESNRAGLRARLVSADGRRQSAALVEWIDLASLALPLAIEPAGDGTWRRTRNPAAPPATGFLIWWEGGPAEPVADRPAADATALDQLRALGYLE